MLQTFRCDAACARSVVDAERRRPVNFHASTGYGLTVDPDDRGPDSRLLDLEEAAEAALEVPSAVQLLDSAAALVVTAVGSCAFSAVVAPARGRLTAIAASDPKALRFERLQAQVGEGPSLDAATTGRVVSVVDMAQETRWPGFAPRALAVGIRSVLVIATGPDRGAVLSLYAREA